MARSKRSARRGGTGSGIDGGKARGPAGAGVRKKAAAQPKANVKPKASAQPKANVKPKAAPQAKATAQPLSKATGATTRATKRKTTAAARRAATRSADRVVETAAEVVIDAVVTPEPADARATFESLHQANRARVLLDDGFSTVHGEERIDATALARLRAHVLVMRHGRFAQGERYGSLAEDAEALVGEHLRAWLASLPRNDVARIVLVAHDVRAGEEETLRLARHHSGWWLANGVYPIHVVWESGFGETVVQLVEAARQKALGPGDALAGGLDPLLEGAVRVLGGPTLLAGVRRGAERAFDIDGGGRRLLGFLRDELARAPRPVELHLVADGAGAAFQAQAMRHLVEHRMGGLSAVRTLSLLAPAISVAEFRRSIASSLGFALRHASLFTLARDCERAERCGPYRRSFLSLLRGALEEEPMAEILGLEESLRRSPDVARLFGLGGAGGAFGEALFAGIAPGLTESPTTAGFVDDVATMNSVLRRVLDQPLGGIIGYQPLQAAGESSSFDRRLEEEFERRGIDFAWVRSKLLAATSAPTPSIAHDGPDIEDVTPVQPSVDVAAWDELSDDDAAAGSSSEPSAEPGDERWRDVALRTSAPHAGSPRPTVEIVDPTSILARRAAVGPRGHRSAPTGADGPIGACRALSIGIDRYPGQPLNGAVADALLWNETFARLGFATREPLLDADATRAGILAGIRSLLAESRPGDVVAVHFSGCGARVGDAWEEEGSEGPGRAYEALAPFDVDGGAFVLGGDLAELLRDAPEGVHVTFFLDCSFSGGASRIHGAHLGEDREETPDVDGERDTDIEPLRRTLRVGEALDARHAAFRRRLGQLARPGAGWDESPRGASALFYLAARADGCAWERDGYGDFSLAATRVLRTSSSLGHAAAGHPASTGHGAPTNEAFLEAVREILSETSPQRPELQCLGVSRSAPLFRVQPERSALATVDAVGELSGLPVGD